MFFGKTVLIGVCGGIAAYKACELTSKLLKSSATVEVIMTENATRFVTPLTFESLTGREAVTDMFRRNKEWEIEHISFAKKADIMVIIPATANVIGKLASGIADDMLTTTFMACKAPKVICPAMNTAMYEDAKLQENLDILRKRGFIIIEPECGRLACGDVGAGKLAEIDKIYGKVSEVLMPKPDFDGKTVLVTAGATRENIDGVRFISNYSSGKMGVEIARSAINRGAKVILITGSISVEFPKGIVKHIKTVSTEDMYNAVMSEYEGADYVIMAAAPADYTVTPNKNKIKSEELTLQFKKTTDIAKEIGKVKGRRKLIIFSAETENLIENAESKLQKKNADMVVANDVTKEGAGFNTDTNIVTIITKAGIKESFNIMPKSEVATVILDRALKL